MNSPHLPPKLPTGPPRPAVEFYPPELRRAKHLLVLLGVVTLGFGAWYYYRLRPALLSGHRMMDAGHDDLGEEVRLAYAAILGLGGSGVAFIILGFLVKRFPLGAPLSALLMFLFTTLIRLMAPGPVMSLAGILVVVFSIFLLIFAIQSGVEYRRSALFGGYRR